MSGPLNAYEPKCEHEGIYTDSEGQRWEVDLRGRAAKAWPEGDAPGDFEIVGDGLTDLFEEIEAHIEEMHEHRATALVRRDVLLAKYPGPTLKPADGIGSHFDNKAEAARYWQRCLEEAKRENAEAWEIRALEENLERARYTGD